MLDVSDRVDHWRVLKIGQGGADCNYVEQWRRLFKTFNALPRKTQEAVSELRMCKVGESIEDRGQRIGEKTFWLKDSQELLEEYNENEPEQ